MLTYKETKEKKSINKFIYTFYFKQKIDKKTIFFVAL